MTPGDIQLETVIKLWTSPIRTTTLSYGSFAADSRELMFHFSSAIWSKGYSGGTFGTDGFSQ